MPDNKSISQLTTAEQTTSSDLFETSIPNGALGYLSRKVSLDSIADYIGSDHLFSSDLQTTDKTLTGAINEAASGGGGASIEEMTQAEYNALTPEQKADGTLRAITDATTSIGDIDNVNISSVADGDALIYDSTSSKWVNTSLNSATSPLFGEKTYTYTAASVDAGANINISRTDFSITDINGYKPIAMRRVGVSKAGFEITSFNAVGSSTVLSIKNNTSAAIANTTFTITIIYIKSNFLHNLT